MALKNICYCVDCKCNSFCFYSNRRQKIDFTPFDFIIIDISCIIANCEYLQDSMPAPTSYGGYVPTTRFEYLLSKHLHQISHYLDIAKTCVQELKSTPCFKEFLSDFLLDKLNDLKHPAADDIKKQIDDILLLLSL